MTDTLTVTLNCSMHMSETELDMKWVLQNLHPDCHPHTLTLTPQRAGAFISHQSPMEQYAGELIRG